MSKIFVHHAVVAVKTSTLEDKELLAVMKNYHANAENVTLLRSNLSAQAAKTQYSKIKHLGVITTYTQSIHGISNAGVVEHCCNVYCLDTDCRLTRRKTVRMCRDAKESCCRLADLASYSPIFQSRLTC